jgi:ubiquinone/menaquinone biosynthesis C-methylase UbiE
MGVSTEKLKLGTMEEMVYPENTFDYVSFGAVLEHLYNPSEAILKALTWTRPGGIVFIEVPSSDWLVNKMINFYYRLRGSDYVGNISPMHVPYHLYEFNIRSFQAHADLHGYEVAQHEYSVCQTFMPKPVDVVIKPYMKWTNTGMQLFVWLRKIGN